MARAEEPALPVGTQSVRLFRSHIGWRAAQVGADADQYQILRLDRAMTIAGVVGLLVVLRGRIAQTRIQPRQRIQRLFAATNDPHRFTAPFDCQLCARLERADVDLNGSTDRFRFRAGQPGGHEWHCARYHADAPDNSSAGGQKPTPATIYAITHYLDDS